jgi:hypothetical protein
MAFFGTAKLTIKQVYQPCSAAGLGSRHGQRVAIEYWLGITCRNQASTISNGVMIRKPYWCANELKRGQWHSIPLAFEYLANAEEHMNELLEKEKYRGESLAVRLHRSNYRCQSQLYSPE